MEIDKFFSYFLLFKSPVYLCFYHAKTFLKTVKVNYDIHTFITNAVYVCMSLRQTFLNSLTCSKVLARVENYLNFPTGTKCKIKMFQCSIYT